VFDIGKKDASIDKGQNSFSEVSSDLITILNSASVKKYKQRLLTDAAAVTMKAAAARSSIHGARKRMKKGKSRRQIARVLESLDLKNVEGATNLILRENAKKHFRGKTLSIAIDVHDIPYHGLFHERKDEVNRSKPKEGTTHFHSIATAYVIGKNGKRFTLAILFVRKHTSMLSIVIDLLLLIRKCKIDINILLLDKGFYAINVVKRLMRLGISFIIPMRGKRLTKKKGSYQTLYRMKSTADGKPKEQLVNAVSVIRYNKGRRFNHRGAMQLCFITYKIRRNPRQIAEFYRKRFGIESSYKLDKSIRSRTSTRNPAIRLFLFSAAVLLQNIWVGIKFIFCKHLSKTSKDMVTLHDFADTILYWIRKLYGETIGFRKPG